MSTRQLHSASVEQNDGGVYIQLDGAKIIFPGGVPFAAAVVVARVLNDGRAKLVVPDPQELHVPNVGVV